MKKFNFWKVLDGLIVFFFGSGSSSGINSGGGVGSGFVYIGGIVGIFREEI